MMTTIKDVKPKRYYRAGQLHQPENTQGNYNAEIKPRESIRVFGVMTNHTGGPQSFNKTFKIGDRAEYDSYNLIYTGEIVGIGEKTVTIKDTYRMARMDLYGFIDRNWNFDAKKIAAYNAVESQCI